MPIQKKPARVSVSKRHGQIEHISIFGITERMGPLALHMYADSFLTAANSLPPSSAPFDPVRPYLVCHSIELGLKAFLSIRGLPMIDLAHGSYGHNLTAILEQTEATGLLAMVPLSGSHRDAIRLASIYYFGKVFEYPAVGEAMSGYRSMPPIDTLLDAASIIVQSLRQPSREAN